MDMEKLKKMQQSVRVGMFIFTPYFVVLRAVEGSRGFEALSIYGIG
jgi:hypothetical protein